MGRWAERPSGTPGCVYFTGESGAESGQLAVERVAAQVGAEDNEIDAAGRIRRIGLLAGKQCGDVDRYLVVEALGDDADAERAAIGDSGGYGDRTHIKQVDEVRVGAQPRVDPHRVRLHFRNAGVVCRCR